MLSQQDMRNILRHRCEEAGSQAALARNLGVSIQYIHDVLAGRRQFSANLAARIGYERKIVFSPCNQPKSNA